MDLGECTVGEFEMTAIILAVIGWVLFILTAILYRAGIRIDAEESNALAAHSLAVMLSNEFRMAVRAGFDRALEEDRPRGTDSKTMTYWLMEAVRQNAKTCYKPDAEINTISVVMHALTEKA
jgi:hypothetical protein